MEVTELCFERNFTKPTIVIRTLPGHIACVFVFVGGRDFRCRKKNHFDLLPAHFRKCIKAQLIRGCFAF